MKYKRLGFLRQDASCIALGSVPMGTSLNEQLSFEILDGFMDIGGNFIDTARVYGDIANGVQGVAEQTIGRWMRARANRDKVILSTKGAHPPTHDAHISRMTPENIFSDCQQSLTALDTDYIDIYFLHRDDTKRPVAEIMDALNLLIKQGKVRALGASNWTSERILQANAYCLRQGLVGFSINQPQWALARQINKEDDTLVQMDKPLYAYHRTTGMPLMAYTSLAKGFFTKISQGGLANLNDKAKRRYLGDDNMRLYGKLLSYAPLLNLSINALSLAFLTSQPFSAYPIVGVSSLAQLAQLSEAGDAVLPEKFVNELNDLCGF